MTKAGVLVGIVGGVIAICGTIVAVSQYFERLSGRISQLEEKVHSLAASSSATAAALNEMSKKPGVAANPMLQKCVELADEVNTGQRNTVLAAPTALM